MSPLLAVYLAGVVLCGARALAYFFGPEVTPTPDAPPDPPVAFWVRLTFAVLLAALWPLCVVVFLYQWWRWG